jgi:quinolinate synthase
MGQSVKVLAPQKRVLMPKIACCAMAKMIDTDYFSDNIKKLNSLGIKDEDILPITYINSSAEVKAQVGKMNGYVCTSSNAHAIITKGLESGKKIFFVPDRCLGQNFANKMKLKSSVIGVHSDEVIKDSDIICYNGFCSVHQLFTRDDIDFYRNKFEDIIVAVHPECDPTVVDSADFVGSTSQLITYIKGLDPEQKVVVGTEFNMVNRLRQKNTYILSQSKPECPTMNETTLEDVYIALKSIEDETYINEIFVDEEIAKYANIALNRMFEV